MGITGTGSHKFRVSLRVDLRDGQGAHCAMPPSSPVPAIPRQDPPPWLIYPDEWFFFRAVTSYSGAGTQSCQICLAIYSSQRKKKSYEALENHCEMLDEWVKELEQMMTIVTWIGPPQRGWLRAHPFGKSLQTALILGIGPSEGILRLLCTLIRPFSGPSVTYSAFSFFFVGYCHLYGLVHRAPHFLMLCT